MPHSPYQYSKALIKTKQTAFSKSYLLQDFRNHPNTECQVLSKYTSQVTEVEGQQGAKNK